MPLVPMRAILEATHAHGYAQGAFNINAWAQAEAAVEIHDILRSPAIIQAADPANGFMGGNADFLKSSLEDKKRGAKNIAAAVEKFAARASVPVALHLDHGRDFASVQAAVDAGYTSVMIDGSSLPYEENVELTREVVKYAHARGVTVEGELGVLSGMEDHVFSETSAYTNPLQAVDFVRRTGCDALAISYGTMHGANKGKGVRLRVEIAAAIRECLLHEGLFCALVSHGSSTVPRYLVEELESLGGEMGDAAGISLGEIHGAIAAGIEKINVDTDIRLAVTRNMRALFLKNPALQSAPKTGEIYRLLSASSKVFDPRAYLPPILDTLMTGADGGGEVAAVTEAMKRGVQEILGRLIVEFGSAGRASLVKPVTLEEMAARYAKQG